MVKKLFFLIVFASTVSLGYAYNVPRDIDGDKAESLEDVGVYALTARGGTSNPIIRGSSIAVYGVLIATRNGGDFDAGATNFVELRAATNPITTSELFVPAIEASTNTRNTFLVFKAPLIAPDGLTIHVTSAATTATVFYRFLATSTRENIWIPRDADGIKTHNSEFYGIKVATLVTAGADADGAMIGTEGLDYTSQERVIATNRGLLFGMMSGTGSVSNFVVFEDTASTIGDTADLLPSIFYNAWTYEDSINSSGNKVVWFPWPIIYENGLTVRRSSAADRFRVFIRPARSLR